MLVFKVVAILWDLLVLVIAFHPWAPGLPSTPWLLFGTALLITSIGTFFNSRIAWFVCLALLAVAFLASLVFVLVNLGAFLFAHPRYTDSPGTIIVVAIASSVTLLPLTVLAILLWRDRENLLAILKFKNQSAG